MRASRAGTASYLTVSGHPVFITLSPPFLLSASVDTSRKRDIFTDRGRRWGCAGKLCG